MRHLENNCVALVLPTAASVHLSLSAPSKVGYCFDLVGSFFELGAAKIDISRRSMSFGIPWSLLHLTRFGAFGRGHHKVVYLGC